MSIMRQQAVPISLDAHLNWKGVTWRELDIQGQVDPRGASIPGEVYPQEGSLNIGGIPFHIPASNSAREDMVSCEGQQIVCSKPGQYETLIVLGFSVFGDYSDFIGFSYENAISELKPLELTDWFQYYPNKSALFGEETAFEIPYFLDEAEEVARPVAVWLQRIPCNPALTLQQIRLPDNPFMFIVAMTLT